MFPSAMSQPATGSNPPAPVKPALARDARPLYRICRRAALLIYEHIYRVEAFGSEHVPGRGPLLIASNHQSYIDPPLVGGMVPWEMHFVARSGLFSFKPFAWLISRLNSIPIREDAGDLGAIKELLKRLAEGKSIVIFPEGSRCDDGAMGEFKRGVALLVKRAKCPVVPAAVEGCFDAWPRGGPPRLLGKRIAVKYGRPIPNDELMKDGADAALERLAREIDGMRMELRAHMRSKTRGRYPAPGPGDLPRADVDVPGLPARAR